MTRVARFVLVLLTGMASVACNSPSALLTRPDGGAGGVAGGAGQGAFCRNALYES